MTHLTSSRDLTMARLGFLRPPQPVVVSLRGPQWRKRVFCVAVFVRYPGVTYTCMRVIISLDSVSGVWRGTTTNLLLSYSGCLRFEMRSCAFIESHLAAAATRDVSVVGVDGSS